MKIKNEMKINNNKKLLGDSPEQSTIAGGF